MRHPLFLKCLHFASSILAGWIAAFSMAPASYWPCLFIGLSGLYWLYSRTLNGPQAFFTGFFFALGYFVTGLWWIGNALLVEGNEFAWVWPISVIGLPTLLGLFTGLYLACARIVSSPATLKGFLAFCLFLTFSEFGRGHAFTGFPWNLYGYVWADYLPMAQISHYIGAYGLTILSVFWATLAGFLIVSANGLRTKSVLAGIAVVSIMATYSFGQARLSANEQKLDRRNGLVVVQPNIAQDMKWDPVAIQANFEKTVSLSRSALFADPQPENIFIVWPETAISPATYTIPENMESIRGVLNSYTKSAAYLVTGVLLRRFNDDDTTRYSNSVSLLDKDLTPLATYDKTHLVPFGEFIPFQDWIPLKPVAAFKGFDAGKGVVTVAHESLPSFSPLVCYEVIFPDDVTAQPRPAWMVNVTNDGWYGDSAGPYQHFAQTRLRAIEEGIPIVRSANTGISGIIDPYGRVIESADIYREASIVSYIPESLPASAWRISWLLNILLPLAALILMLRPVIFIKQR